MRPLVLFAVLLLLAAGSLLYSLVSGSIDIGLRELFSVLAGREQDISDRVITELRWPRTASAFTTGALLALSGGLMQVLLRNPLADPYVLGVSGGAATGALLALSLIHI